MLSLNTGVSAPRPSGWGAPPIRVLGVLGVVAAFLAAAASAGCAQPAGSPATGPSASARTVSISATDRAACAQLFGRLQQVTLAITASSELIANSVDKQQLAQRIAQEAAQLRGAADLMTRGPVPAPLVKADQDLVAALRVFAADFDRAKNAAAGGDFRAAVDEMRDEPAVQRIVNASQTIEDSCRSG